MAKTLKKTKPLVAKKFVTRSQAIRKLQLKLNDFRHICILKGIFPKEPPKCFKGPNKTYYSMRDIKFLANEKILTKFREIKAYQKKIIRAQNKKQKFDAELLKKNKPIYDLTHIIKERYPTFNDALKDVDDALCLLGIFSTLPKYGLLQISEQKSQQAKKLLREFFLYSAVSQSVRKGFISIKGIYLSTSINDNFITWLNPYNHPQKMTYEIDYEIINDFLELYLELMKFVNYKLYKDIGLEYPLPEENSDSILFGFNSEEIKNLQKGIQKNKTNNIDNVDNNTQQQINVQSDELQKIKKKEEETNQIKNLFNGLIFYISREVPKEIFEVIISSCGGLFGDDDEHSSFKENDKRITHYIVDRPVEGIEFKKNKEYIQPQWIFDCLNQKKLLPISEYAPGKKLPPHISPYYSVDEQGDYVYEGVDDNENEDVTNKGKVEQPEITKEDLELREMMLSNNKKKLLKKIRDEEIKKKKKKIVNNKENKAIKK